MKRVLIVDDAIDLGRMLQDALKVTRPGIPITVVPSAEEALLEATRFSYDLLITDLRLPGMSGLELIGKIRARQPAIKIIVITALAPEDRLFRQTEEVQMDAFLRKPISIAAFIETVDQLIGAEPDSLPSHKEESSTEEAFRPWEDAQPAGQTAGEGILTGQEAPAPQETLAPVVETQSAGQLSMPGEQTEEIMRPSGPKPALPAEPALPEESAAAVLDRLRAALGALTVLLIDAQGNPVALSGAAPDPALVERLVPAAFASLNAGAAVSSLLAPAASGALQAFRGVEMDILLAPAASRALLVFLKSGCTALRLAIAVEEVLAVQAELSACLAGGDEGGTPLGEVVPPQAPPEVFGATKSLSDEDIDADLEESLLSQDPDLEKLEALAAGKSAPKSQPEDPDAFWEAAAGNESGGLDHPGSLSYDQAQKLGLIDPGDG